MESGTLSLQYPSPAHHHRNSSFEVGRSAAPNGTMSCRIHGKSVGISTCPSVYLSVLNSGMDKDGCMHRFPLQDIVPFEATAQ